MFTLKSGKNFLILERPLVMGIVNTTPDSFSDGGAFSSFEKACRHADEMISRGAALIDIGGESTRPGAKDVSLEEELSRVIPLIEYVAAHHDVWISIDTSKPEVMRQAVEAGAHLINDVRALQEPGALEMAARLDVPVCLMHMQGQPRTMQASPEYAELISDIKQFFVSRMDACVKAGVKRANILLDPGFGFGKTMEHNYELLGRMTELTELDAPLLIGLSRKSMFGQLLGREVSQRLSGSLAGALLAAQAGARIVRVHDVQETRDVLDVFNAVEHFKR